MGDCADIEVDPGGETVIERCGYDVYECADERSNTLLRECTEECRLGENGETRGNMLIEGEKVSATARTTAVEETAQRTSTDNKDILMVSIAPPDKH